jgi:alkylation response protein AidB-like acyl-CoA dehydrogenase
MDFELSEDQKMLVDTAQTFVRKESPVERARKLRDDATGWDRKVWKQMGDMGWLSLPFPEDVGGFGGSFVEVALVLEVLGTTLVPEPFVPSVVLAGRAIDRAGTAEQRARLLGPMIAGDTSLAFGYTERESRFHAHVVATRAEKSGDGYLLRGEKIWVDNGHAADHLVVTARTSGAVDAREGISLFVLPKDAPGLRVQPVKTMDGRRAAILHLEGARAELLGAEGAALPIVEEVLDHGVAAACAEAAGLIRTALWMTVEYLRVREQFGVKIGTFQALQHRAVDMFIESELAKSVSILAALKLAEPPEERAYHLSQAKVGAVVSGRFVVQQATQLHGGIGVTDEHDIGLYFKRMRVLEALYGDEDFHLARFTSSPRFLEG